MRLPVVWLRKREPSTSKKPEGGRGILLGGIPGVKPANVLVIGGGVVGVNAAKIAAGMGANTTIMDIDMNRLRYLDDVMARNVDTMFSSQANIQSMLPNVDMVIGAVLKPGAKAPHLITREMLSDMQKGSGIGRCCDRPGRMLRDLQADNARSSHL
ncbi:MAG: NAD-binding protein [Fodinibius sp.]|nr:NAD-binding protein [Fodinibius sp.]